MHPVYYPKAGKSEETTAFHPGSEIWVRRLSILPPVLCSLPYKITNINQSAVDNTTRQTRSPFPVGPELERPWDGRSTENDEIDAFGYLVNSENTSFPDGKKPLRSERSSRGGPLHVGEFVLRGGFVRGSGPVRRSEPARGGAYNSRFFNPGRSSQI